MLERTLCGLELYRDAKKSKVTPHRHACTCFTGIRWSSGEVCHRCSCLACTEARVKWDRYIARGGLLGEQRRKRAAAARRARHHAK
jgi:hypothetical protein